jgi:hypothetical protein
MAKAPTKSKRESNASRFGEDVVRKAMTVAVMKRSNRGYAWTQAAKAIGSRKDVVAHWPERYPQIWEEVKGQCEKKLEEVAPSLIELLLDNANRAAQEWNNRLKNEPASIKDFALTGILDYSIKNAQLLQNRPTGIEESHLNLTEKVVIELHEIEKAERLKTLHDSQNRIKKYNEN